MGRSEDQGGGLMERFLTWPVRGGGWITQRFGEDLADYSRFGLIHHNGIDIADTLGTEILAAHDGQVWLYNDPGGYGNTIELWSPTVSAYAQYKTIYAHLSQFRVRNHAMVKQGDVLGLMGSTGNSTGSHVHFGLKYLMGIEGRKGCNPGYRDWVDPWPALISRVA